MPAMLSALVRTAAGSELVRRLPHTRTCPACVICAESTTWVDGLTVMRIPMRG